MDGALPALLRAMAARELDLPDLDTTIRLGAALARLVHVGDVIALHGDLGAGKTELARAIIRAAAGDADLIVPSPTFTLVETYDAPRAAIWHFDLYRIDAPDQVWELGLEEALADGVALIEWPERLGGMLPARRLDLTLRITDGDARRAMLAGDPSWTERIDALAGAFAHG
jgi:tRNA threonylcarbamoyl adenosine modification protein YjeE